MECHRMLQRARAAPSCFVFAPGRVRQQARASRTAHPLRASSQQQQAQQSTAVVEERPKPPASAPPAVLAVAAEGSNSTAPLLGSWTSSLGSLLLLKQLADLLQQVHPGTGSRPPSVGVTAAVHHPATAAVALGMFALIAYDVAAPSSAHLLPQLDAAVHQWVVTHTDAAFRATTADLLVSDLFITAGIWGWLATSCITLAAAPRAGALPLGIAWLAYYTTCGAVFTDPPLVSALKHAFGRVRPSTIHHTFSFPSGHTSAAVFIAGMLLVVLLPLASASLQSAQRRLARRHSQHNSAAEVLDAGADGQQQPQQQAVQLVTHDVTTVAPTSVVGSFAADQAPAPAATAAVAAATAAPTHSPALLVTHHRAHVQQQQQQAVAGDHSSQHRLDLSTAWLPDGVVLGLWGAAWGLTATGRVLADAHWVSDTLAGGCLAVGVVSGVACATQWLHNRRPRS